MKSSEFLVASAEQSLSSIVNRRSEGDVPIPPSHLGDEGARRIEYCPSVRLLCRRLAPCCKSVSNVSRAGCDLQLAKGAAHLASWR